MGQSESSNLGKRSFTVEFIVGLFTLAGVAAIAYLCIGIAGLKLGSGGQYEIVAKFGNIAGLKYGSPLEVAGVQIGEVDRIELDRNQANALLTLRIDDKISIYADDTFHIRTKGIIGDRYIALDRGGSDEVVPPGTLVTNTFDAMDIEDIIGKAIDKMGSSSESDGDKK